MSEVPCRVLQGGAFLCARYPCREPTIGLERPRVGREEGEGRDVRVPSPAFRVHGLRFRM